MTTPPQHSRISLRLSAYFHGASFLIVGIKAPFWPVWLAGRGLGAREIAALFAAAIWVNVATTPLLGAVADRFDRRRAVMVGLCGVAILGYASLWNAYAFWPLLGLTLITATAQTALMPLGDSITLAAVRRDGIDYGRVRVWGSVSFILAAMASGAVLSRSPVGGGNPVLALVLVASVVLLVACLAIPAAARAPEGAPSRRAALGALARDRRFWQFVTVAAALQASHQVYYGFGTLYWRSLGFSDAVIGLLWAEGVVAEILLFWQGTRLLARASGRSA